MIMASEFVCSPPLPPTKHFRRLVNATCLSAGVTHLRDFPCKFPGDAIALLSDGVSCITFVRLCDVKQLAVNCEAVIDAVQVNSRATLKRSDVLFHKSQGSNTCFTVIGCTDFSSQLPPFGPKAKLKPRGRFGPNWSIALRIEPLRPED